MDFNNLSSAEYDQIEMALDIRITRLRETCVKCNLDGQLDRAARLQVKIDLCEKLLNEVVMKSIDATRREMEAEGK